MALIDETGWYDKCLINIESDVNRKVDPVLLRDDVIFNLGIRDAHKESQRCFDHKERYRKGTRNPPEIFLCPFADNEGKTS